MRHLFFLAMLLIPATGFAQSTMDVQRGTMFAGGQINFQTHEMDFPAPTGDASVKTFNFVPQFGWFMKSYLAAVGGIGYQSVSGDTAELNRFSVSGGVRLFQPLAMLHIYLGAEAGLYFTSYEANDADTMDFGFSFPLGVLIPLSRQVALDVGLRVSKIWRDNDHPVGQNYDSFIVDVGYLGVQAFF